jgi:large subunit ribosomal protein L11
MRKFVITASRGVFSMAEKPIKAQVKLQLPAGAATPAPPVGSTLGPHGINLPGFVKQFNDATAKDKGLIIPVVVTIYGDRSFDFVLKTPPTAILIMKALGLEKGSQKPNKEKVGKITKAQVRQIAEQKMVDLNCTSIESAESMVMGAARSMGVVVID